MKLAKRFLFGALSALLLAGCSDDKLGNEVPDEGPGTANRDGVFMSVNIKMPSTVGSRSWTDDPNQSSGGTEVGKDTENNVNNVYLVLATTDDNTFIGWGEIPASGIVKSADGTNYQATASFDRSQLTQFYAKLDDDDSRDVNVFVFCNPTLSLLNILKKAGEYNPRNNAWANAEGIGVYDPSDPNSEVIWSENNFLMSNNAIAIRSLPKTMADWDAFTEKSHPFNLSNTNEGVADCDNSAGNTLAVGGPRGPIQVERTAARFDFKDASDNHDQIYHVVFSDKEYGEGENAAKICYVDVKLNKMSLTNMAKKYYYLRRVSDNGFEDASSNVKLCGPELPWFTDDNGHLVESQTGNYVVSPIAQAMAGPITNDFSEYFSYPFFSPEGEIDNPVITNWFTSNISDVVAGEANDQKKEYHIWRYLTENTIPGYENQKNGQSTGIVFKGKMIATAAALNSDDENIRTLAHYINNEPLVAGGEKPLTGNLDTDPIIYKFEGRRNEVGGMYATWLNVEQTAKQDAIVPVWEVDNDKDKYPEGGYWRLEINRSNTLFSAVFGDGSCGSYTFKDSTGKEYTEDDPLGDKVDKSAPSYAWHLWDEAGRPVPGSGADADKIELYYNFKKAAVAKGFTLYQTSYDSGEDYGYYCYYYYWNRHNDNGMNGIMGPMEFAVVRNNVYKIAVTAIRNIGHPRITINDPKKPTPDTDDESDDIYIAVDVDVLPWVVRVNNVEF